MSGVDPDQEFGKHFEVFDPAADHKYPCPVCTCSMQYKETRIKRWWQIGRWSRHHFINKVKLQCPVCRYRETRMVHETYPHVVNRRVHK